MRRCGARNADRERKKKGPTLPPSEKCCHVAVFAAAPAIVGKIGLSVALSIR